MHGRPSRHRVVLKLVPDRYRPSSYPASSIPQEALPPPGQTRSNMRYSHAVGVLIGAATLSGCTEGVLDPQGPIAAAERLILSNSLGIMLAIVIPTILATLGLAWSFRS